MDRKQRDVLDWMEKHGHPTRELSEAPCFPPNWKELYEPRLKLIREETNELQAAFETHDVVEIADALVDLLWVVYGTANMVGLRLNALWDEVKRSNNTKSVGAWKPKGETYEPPNLKDFLALEETWL